MVENMAELPKNLDQNKPVPGVSPEMQALIQKIMKQYQPALDELAKH